MLCYSSVFALTFVTFIGQHRMADFNIHPTLLMLSLCVAWTPVGCGMISLFSTAASQHNVLMRLQNASLWSIFNQRAIPEEDHPGPPEDMLVRYHEGFEHNHRMIMQGHAPADYSDHWSLPPLTTEQERDVDAEFAELETTMITREEQENSDATVRRQDSNDGSHAYEQIEIQIEDLLVELNIVPDIENIIPRTEDGLHEAGSVNVLSEWPDAHTVDVNRDNARRFTRTTESDNREIEREYEELLAASLLQEPNDIEPHAEITASTVLPVTSGRNDRTFECLSCTETVREVDAPVVESCNHAPQTCSDCFAKWIETKLVHTSWNQAFCPECPNQLEYRDIQQYARRETFERYNDFLARRFIESDAQFRECPLCGVGQIFDDIENAFNVAESQHCQGSFCTRHSVRYHWGETCEEYDDRARQAENREARQERVRMREEQEAASQHAIGRLTKKCPRPNCGVPIEKNNGCNHMVCTHCRHHFCWQCMEPWIYVANGEHDPLGIHDYDNCWPAFARRLVS